MTKPLKLFTALFALLFSSALFAQSTVTLTPSITAGAGEIVTDISWSTSPALTSGTPCVAGATPAVAGWSGPMAGSGTVEDLTIVQNTRLTLVCTFPGDSIVTYTWTNPTTNTDSTPYTNPKLIRIKQTFDTEAVRSNVQLAGAQCGSTPTVLCTDVPQTPTPRTTHTVTGITQTGTLRATAIAINQTDDFSDASNFVTKVFNGSFTVNQGVDITVRSVPGPVTNFGAE